METSTSLDILVRLVGVDDVGFPKVKKLIVYSDLNFNCLVPPTKSV